MRIQHQISFFVLCSAGGLAACEGDTSGLGDGNVALDGASSGPDAGPRDVELEADVGPADSGVLPEEWAVVPCPASAIPLASPLIAGNGPLDGVLTVFVFRYPATSALDNSRVVLRKAERTLEGLTDERGCVRFIGQGLVGPIELTATAPDYTLSVVRGLSSAQFDTALESRASLAEPITIPPPPVGTVAGTITGFERFPSVTSTGTESRRVRAEVRAIYRRGALPFGQPEAGRRPAPNDALETNLAYVGKLDRGISPTVDLRDFELPVWTDDFVGLQVEAEHEINWWERSSPSVRPYVGLSIGLSVEPNGRLEDQVIDLVVPNTRAFQVELPAVPAWASSNGWATALYIPAIDGLAFSRSVGQRDEPLLRPEFVGMLSEAEELITVFASGEPTPPQFQAPSMAVYARTRAAVAEAPPFPSRPEITVTGRRLSISFSGAREGARVTLSFRSATGVFTVRDFSNDSSFDVEIPPADEFLAVPEQSATMILFSDWFRDSESSEVRVSNDGVELRARYTESGDVTLAPN